MRRIFWMMAALTFLGLGPGTLGVRDARAQWVGVSSVRYGLLGRPRAVETRWVPTMDVVPTTYVGTRYIDEPVVTTSYVERAPSTVVLPTRYVSAYPVAVPTTSVTTYASPVVETRYVRAAPVVRSYVPTPRVIETRTVILP